MAKKEVFLIILLFVSFTYADISSSIRIGEGRYFLTQNQNISVFLLDYNSFTNRHNFIINEEEYSLLKFQSVNIGSLVFTLLSPNGNSIESFSSDFVISNNVEFSCITTCENSSIVDYLKIVKPDFELCKKNCSIGCGLFKEKICNDGNSEIINNCRDTVETLEICEEDCSFGSCYECNTCKSEKDNFYCKECQEKDYCLSDDDCPGLCISGTCSSDPFIVGDSLCSLPLEECTSIDCSCYGPPPLINKDFPIILLHGFASDPSKLKRLQRKLTFDLGYDDGGEISIFDYNCQTNSKKAVYLASYYESENRGVDKRLKDEKSVFYSLYSKAIDENKERNFVDILEEAVDRVKICSDSDKVNLIVHSMGGIVARSYILEKNNIKDLNKIIFLGTPLHGEFYGEQTYKLFEGLERPLGETNQLLDQCSSAAASSIAISLIDGRDFSDDCVEMQKASTFTHPIWDIDETPGLIQYYTIAGKIDHRGDGMVELQSVALSGAISNKIVSCNHFDLKDPLKCQSAYIEMITALGYSTTNIKDTGINYYTREIFASIGDFFVNLFE